MIPFTAKVTGIMQIKNNYRIKWQRKDRMEEEGEGIFNGEMGEISQINEKARELYGDI